MGKREKTASRVNNSCSMVASVSVPKPNQGVHLQLPYDIKQKHVLRTQEKYYLADTGLQHAICECVDSSFPGILENIVYSELVRR